MSETAPRERLARRIVQRRSERNAPLATVQDVQGFLARLPARSPLVRLTVEVLDLVRVLTLAEGNDPSTTRLQLRVTEWQRPYPRWTGTLGPLNSVTVYQVRYPSGTVGVAEVDIEFDVRTPLSTIMRGIYPLLGVTRPLHGYGFAEIGTASAPASALALLPTRIASGIPELPSEQLDGLGLSRADLGLVGTSEALEAYTESAADPARTLLQRPLLVELGGHLAISDRTELPLIDLNVHNPIGRTQAFEKTLGSISLRVVGDRLHFTAPEGVEGLPSWWQPDTVALSWRRVRDLRRTEAIDLSGVAVADRPAELRLYRRLAELAATGVVLHSLPPQLALAPDILGESLATRLRQPYRSSMGLTRDLRSVPQRREAMTRFGGFFELAGHAQTWGQRLLPAVSLVMSSMRPQRLAPVLRAFAGQRYPHVEIVVGVHGSTELTGEFTEAVRESGALVASYDRSVPFGSVLADTARRASGDLIIKVDDDDVYGPEFVGDLVLAWIYSNADIVGKTTEYLYLEDLQHTIHRKFIAENYHPQLAGGSMLLSQATLNEIGGWRPSHNSTDRSVLIRIGNGGGIGFRTQSLGYIYVRHSDGHTWARRESQLVANTYEQWTRFMHEVVDD